MDKAFAREAVIAHALPHIPFDGWSMAALKRGTRGAGIKEAALIRLFPGGAIEALDAWVRAADARMEEAYAALEPQPQKIRERIATLIRLRLEAYAAHKQAVRKALSLYAMPMHAHRGVKALARTADAMWHAAGDASTDFNWYTKRALLAGVYSSTLLYWLNDESANHADSWAFLGRRIEDVMRIEKMKQSLKKSIHRKNVIVT